MNDTVVTTPNELEIRVERIEDGAKGGFARVDALLQRLAPDA